MRIIVPVFLLLAMVSACSKPDFDEPSEVEDLRVLAIRLEPPEYIYDQKKCITAEFEDDGLKVAFDPDCLLADVTTKVTFLVADPRYDKHKRMYYHVNGCVLGADFQCLEDKVNEELASVPSYLGSVSMVVTFSPDLLDQSLAADPYGGFFGFAVWMAGDIRSSSEWLSYFRSFSMSPEHPDVEIERVANRNPSIAQILIGPKGEEMQMELSEEGAFEAEGGETYRFLPDVPEEDKEKYTVQAMATSEFIMLEEGVGKGSDEEPDWEKMIYDKEITEDLTVRFYGTCGKFEPDTKEDGGGKKMFYSEEEAKLFDLSTEWTAPEEKEDCTLWFVISDDRGGTNWHVLPVSVSAVESASDKDI